MLVKPGQMIQINTELSMAHEHCWHKTGLALMSNPPQDIERCCHCGEERVVSLTLARDGIQHGPFAAGLPQ
jgi:hypothetical protein